MAESIFYLTPSFSRRRAKEGGAQILALTTLGKIWHIQKIPLNGGFFVSLLLRVTLRSTQGG